MSDEHLVQMSNRCVEEFYSQSPHFRTKKELAFLVFTQLKLLKALYECREA